MTEEEAVVLRVPDDALDFGPDQIMHYGRVPFTGVAFEDNRTGRTEMQYRNGLQHGLTKAWWPSGNL